MKLFKMFGITKRILLISIVLNVTLISAFCLLESKKHVVQQILQVRGIIPAPPENDTTLPDFQARRGWTNTIGKLYSDFDIAFFGNSITFNSDFQIAFPQVSIINLGYPGDNLKGMIKRVPMLQNSNPKKIFIMAGTNDLIVNDVNKYRKEYVQLIDSIRKVLPKSKIYLQSVLPSNHKVKRHYASNAKVKEANRIVKIIADSLNCRYVNLFDLYVGSDGELPLEFTRDGVHLIPEAYDYWIKAIEPLIYE